MEQYRFRPCLDGLEERTVPSASPAEIVAAYTRTYDNADEITHLSETLGRPRTTQTIQFLASNLSVVAAQSRTDAAVLAEYRAELQAAMVANPALVPSLSEFTRRV